MRTRQLIACIAVLAPLALPAGATAAKPTTKALTKASIKAALNSYDAQLETAASHVVSAVDAYTTTKDAAATETAIGEEMTVLREIRTTVKAQITSGHPLLHYGKTLVVEGLKTLIASYEHLSRTYADAATSPRAAKREFAHYQTSIKRALREIHRGVHLV